MKAFFNVFIRLQHDMFLEKGTVTQAQHDKSLGDLIEKMGLLFHPPAAENAHAHRLF